MKTRETLLWAFEFSASSPFSRTSLPLPSAPLSQPLHRPLISQPFYNPTPHFPPQPIDLPSLSCPHHPPSSLQGANPKYNPPFILLSQLFIFRPYLRPARQDWKKQVEESSFPSQQQSSACLTAGPKRNRGEGSWRLMWPVPSPYTSACLTADQRRRRGQWSIRSSGFRLYESPGRDSPLFQQWHPSLVRSSSLLPATWNREEEEGKNRSAVKQI